MTKFLGVDEAAVMRSLNTFYPVSAKEQLSDRWLGKPGEKDAPVVRTLQVQADFLKETGQITTMPKDMNGLSTRASSRRWRDGDTARFRERAPGGGARIKARFEAVSKRFGDGADAVQALEPITLDLAENAFVCLVGPSGCGKSTLLNIMAGFEKATTGRALMDGVPVSGPDPKRGVVFQQGALFTWMNVLDNVAFGPLAIGKSKAEATAHRCALRRAGRPDELRAALSRTSSRAACSSASASPARSPTTPRSC